MRHTQARLVAALLLLGAIASAPTGAAAQQTATAPDPQYLHLLEVFVDTLHAVKQQSVAPVDNRRAIEGAIEGMLTSLDPHSGYIPPATYSAMIKPADSPRSGSLGLKLVNDSGITRIVAAIAGGPAERAGLRSGDAILAIDGRSVEFTPLATVIDQLPGEVGRAVTLRIGRGAGQAFDVTIVRGHVVDPTVKFRFEGDFGVLSISALNDGAADATRRALSNAKAQKPALKGLVLDLRACPGGLLISAVDVASLFVGKGEIVSEIGRTAKDVAHFSGHETDQLTGLPITVLVNEGTASGCEIIAAAMQDRKRATVMGMPTFGQGTIQTVIPLNGGVDGAIKVTTAFQYRPSGRPIQKLGVMPDIVVAQSAAAADDFARRTYVFSEASLPNALDAEVGSSRILPARAESPAAGFSGDYQLQRALETLEVLAKR